MGGWQGMGLDDTFPIRKAIPVGLAPEGSVLGLASLGSVFHRQKRCITVDTIYIHESYHLCGSMEAGMGE